MLRKLIDGRIDFAADRGKRRYRFTIPLMDQAAIDAVRQWHFEPTVVDGIPIPIVMTVTVTFKLSR